MFMFMTYSTFCCHINKLWLYGMYVCMYVHTYIHTQHAPLSSSTQYSSTAAHNTAVHSTQYSSTHHLCFTPLNNTSYLNLCRFIFGWATISRPAFTRAHPDVCDEDCRMGGHGIEGQVAGFCEYSSKVLCSVKCKEFADYLGNCFSKKNSVCWS
jgi:hypothetical protein